MLTERPADKFKAHRPRKGQPLTYNDPPRKPKTGTVTHAEGELCWWKIDGGGEGYFIWCFREGLNTLHDWPTKNAPATEEDSTDAR